VPTPAQHENEHEVVLVGESGVGVGSMPSCGPQGSGINDNGAMRHYGGPALGPLASTGNVSSSLLPSEAIEPVTIMGGSFSATQHAALRRYQPLSGSSSATTFGSAAVHMGGERSASASPSSSFEDGDVPQGPSGVLSGSASAPPRANHGRAASTAAAATSKWRQNSRLVSCNQCHAPVSLRHLQLDGFKLRALAPSRDA
jgi:hypothetical protein